MSPHTDEQQFKLIKLEPPLGSKNLEPEVPKELTVEERRIQAYETHGILCVVVWCVLGFALVAT